MKEKKQRTVAKVEQTFQPNEMPVYQYRLSEHMEATLPKSELAKGMMVSGTHILYRDKWVNFKNEMSEFRNFLVTKKDKKNIIEFQICVPKTGEILDKNY